MNDVNKRAGNETPDGIQTFPSDVHTHRINCVAIASLRAASANGTALLIPSYTVVRRPSFAA